MSNRPSPTGTRHIGPHPLSMAAAAERRKKAERQAARQAKRDKDGNPTRGFINYNGFQRGPVHDNTIVDGHVIETIR